MAAVLDLLYACFDHSRRVFGGPCHCAKFGLNRCSSFDRPNITLGLKMHIIGFFGEVKIGEIGNL